MIKLNRRDFVRLTGATALASAVVGMPMISRAATKKVVVVGGGPGGATTARYLRLLDPSIEVTLIEANKSYHTCFMSNEVLGGMRSMSGIEVGFGGLSAAGVKVVNDMVTGIDADARMVKTKGGASIPYDRCVVAPGIDFKWDIEGTSPEVANTITHAWKAGPQTATLRKQLESMRDGGTVIIAPPPNPFRCPPGPYERASLIAHYLKHNKPKSKILIVDRKDKFSKQGLFTQAWKQLYGFGTDNSLIDWIPAAKTITMNAVSAADMTIETDFETFKGDVINFIPAQKAGKLAFSTGLVNEKGWCPIDKKSFESSKVKNIHVLGDASIATAMPKSGYSANSQGKVCAAAIADLLNGRNPGDPSFINTCYSIASPEHAFSVSMVYRYAAEKNLIAKVKGAGGLSPMDAGADFRKREVAYAHSWYNNIRADIWG